MWKTGVLQQLLPESVNTLAFFQCAFLPFSCSAQLYLYYITFPFFFFCPSIWWARDEGGGRTPQPTKHVSQTTWLRTCPEKWADLGLKRDCNIFVQENMRARQSLPVQNIFVLLQTKSSPRPSTPVRSADLAFLLVSFSVFFFFFFQCGIKAQSWLPLTALRKLPLLLHFHQRGEGSLLCGPLLFLQRSTFGGILCEGNGEHSWAVSHAVYW